MDNLSRWLDKWGDCRYIIFTDAWDVLFYGDATDVTIKIPDSGVLMAAERNCWPDAYLAPHYRGTTSHKYVNGGCLAAKPEELAKWIQAVKEHPCYHPLMMDQQWFNHRKLEGSPLIKTDEETKLFYCMILEAGEIQFHKGKPVNTSNGSEPQFIHFNGKYDPTLFLFSARNSK